MCFGELPVPLILTWYRHDRAGAIARQYVVGHPDGNLFPVGWIDGESAGENTRLLLLQLRALQLALARGFGPVGIRLLALALDRDGFHQRVLGGQDHVGGAKQRIGSGGEHTNRLAARRESEVHIRTFAAADPVTLHLFSALGPIQLVQATQELLRVLRDPEHPLLEGTPHTRVSTDLGLAINDLLVGEGRAELGAPPDGLFLLIGETAIEQLLEDPLGPFVIAGIGRVHFPVPVVRKPERLQLFSKTHDVAFYRDLRVRARLAGVLFRRQPEGIPADRMENVEPPHALVSGDDIGRRVSFRVSHVEAFAARVREHVEDVEFRACAVDIRSHTKDLVVLPVALPLGFYLLERIRCHHLLTIPDQSGPPRPPGGAVNRPRRCRMIFANSVRIKVHG